MSLSPKTAKKQSSTKGSRWFEKSMAILASVNLGLVLFDLSYVPWRDFWLRGTIPLFRGVNIQIPLPPIAQWYDPIKGIEAHRETEKYLNTVNALESQVIKTGLKSPEVENLLQETRTLSLEMIETNPFEAANKSGTLEKIKNTMRDRIRKRTGQKIESSRQAFTTFWSQDYLSNQDWLQESQFFNTKIKPLIEINYYRHIGENGQFIDRFWRIDLFFIGIFGLEFLARTFYLRRRHLNVTWPEAMMWRWYDIFLLIPFFRWLRVIPVIVRLHQSHLLNLDPIKKQINRGFVANFAEELTQVVVIRVINQVQDSIRGGDIPRWLAGQAARPYIDINNTNEVEAIAKVLVNLTVYQVLPKIQPDLEAILRHNVQKTLNQFPLYQNFQNIPGVGQLPNELTDRLIKEISQSAYGILTSSLQEDAVGAELFNHLVEHLTETIKSELQRNHSLEKIQSLLLDMLEEIKLNYVERMSEEDFEQILEQTRQIRQINTLPKVT